MKKIIALLLSLTLSLSLAVFANGAEGLEEAILKAKSIMEIPEDMPEFEYEMQKKTDGSTVWYLFWGNDSQRISASVSDSGNLLSYYRDYGDEGERKLISIADAIEYAGRFAAKVMGENFGSMRVADEDKISLYSYGDRFTVTFVRYENDVPVYNQYCEVSVNKFTGNVENYSATEFDRENKFEAVENLTGLEKAVSSFVNEGGIQLNYCTYSEDKTTKVFPAYRLDGEQFVIDAQSGEKLMVKSEDRLFKAEMNASADAALTGGRLSPEEQKKVAELEELFTEAEIKEMLENKVDEFKGQPYGGSYIHKTANDEYIINLEYGNDEGYFGNATVNAGTGEIYSFYFSTEKLEKKSLPDEKDVTGFVRTLAGDKGEDTVLEKTDNGYYFKRTENGVQVSGDGIRVSCDKEKGYIYNYSITWADIAEFPDVSDVKSPEEILAVISEKSENSLMYMDGNLVYSFMMSGIYNPYTAEKLMYNGEPEKEDKLPVYNDISGHWCETTVKSLIENGFSLEGDSFMPGEMVTQKVFVEFMNYRSVYHDDETIERIAGRYFDQPDLDAPVTRNQAAKAFATDLGLKEIAGKTEIFKAPFADCGQDEFTGYIAVCKAYGIVSGDGNNSFRGAQNITRAELASMIYRNICR